MRLYLSSFDLGTQPQRLLSLAGHGRRAAIIVNALDHRPGARADWLAQQTDKLALLGFTVTELDLRDFFDQPQALEQTLQAIDVVWINGGNAFILRRAMRQSHFDRLIVSALQEDRIVYAGFSAAAVILSAHLEALKFVSDPNEVPAGYATAPIWEGLGLLPFHLVVHYQSNHPESAAMLQEIAYYRQRGQLYRTLRDGEALVIDSKTGSQAIGMPEIAGTSTTLT